MQSTIWGPYILLMVFAVIASVVLLQKFAAPNVTLLTLIITWFSWLVSFSMIALVPIDVYATIAKPTSPEALSILWQISYWSTQFLTWLIIPVMQYYVVAGDYTIWGRLKTAIRRLWRFYLVITILMIAGVVAAAAYGKLSLSTLPQLVITLSNTFGLIVIIGLLGYGLVEIPRVLWRRSYPESRVKWHMHRIGRSAEKLTAACSALKKTLTIVVMTRIQIPPANTELRLRADALVHHAEYASPVPLTTLATVKPDDVSEMNERDLDYALSESGLARLKERLLTDIANFVGFRGEYLVNVRKGLELEAVCKSRQHGVFTPPDGFLSSKSPVIRRLAWGYRCQVLPWVQKVFAITAAAASATLVWCEITIGTGTNPDLSPFSLLVRDPEVRSSVWLEQIIAVATPLAYIAWCCYSSLFKVGGTTFYHIVPSATWAPSLLFNGSWLARYAAPLGFNFLHVIRMNDGYNGRYPVFVELYGLQDVPLLGNGFNTWFPTVLVVYIFLLASNACNACASLFIPPQFRFDADKADDVHTVAGSRHLHAEQEALARGGRLGEGIELPGMTSNGGQGATSGAPSSGVSLVGRSRVELTAATASETHRPLFGGKHLSSSSRMHTVVGNSSHDVEEGDTAASSSSVAVDESSSPDVGRESKGDKIDEMFRRVELGGMGPSKAGAWGGRQISGLDNESPRSSSP